MPNPREAEGKGRTINLGPARPTVQRESPRVAIPQAISRMLTLLLDELDELPSSTRVELRTLRSTICRIYSLPSPDGPANASALAQDLEDDDGVPIEE